MLTHRPHTHRITAALTALLIALAALPGAAAARPGDDSVGPRSSLIQPAERAETVVRTIVVREEAVRALPIVLSGAALLLVIGGIGFVMIRTAPIRRQRLH
jgi:hypothetical protein